MHLQDAIDVIMKGDGNNNPAKVYKIGTTPIGGTVGTMNYEALLDFWAQFDPYEMNTMLVSSDVMLALLKMPEFQNPMTGLNFQGTGSLITPLGAKLLRIPNAGHHYRSGQELCTGNDQRQRGAGGIR